MYDMNDAGPQMSPVGELIPDGSYVKLRMTIRPGGTNGATPLDAGLLRTSRTSDAKLLDCEFTVVEGPFARRKLWQMFTVAGGKLDDKGQSRGWNIAKATFRAMIDSALGLDPRDESPAARQKRVIQGLKQLDGITFAARVMIEPASDPQYSDANKLANVVVPGEPAYAAIMRGESVAAEPVKARPRKSQTAGQQVPGWTTPAAPSDKPWANQPAAGVSPAVASPQPISSTTPAIATGPQWLNG
jgi:hypothetical protein